MFSDNPKKDPTMQPKKKAGLLARLLGRKPKDPEPEDDLSQLDAHDDPSDKSPEAQRRRRRRGGVKHRIRRLRGELRALEESKLNPEKQQHLRDEIKKLTDKLRSNNSQQQQKAPQHQNKPIPKPQEQEDDDDVPVKPTMTYYLIDASAYVYAVENRGKTKFNFWKERRSGRAFLYMPQFCVAEVLNTFARKHYSDKEINEKDYRNWKNELFNELRGGGILYAYDLHHYHNLNADEIFEYAQKAPLGENQRHLSTYDILIIAMGMELKKIHAPNPVVILTRDGRLETVGKQFCDTQWFK